MHQLICLAYLVLPFILSDEQRQTNGSKLNRKQSELISALAESAAKDWHPLYGSHPCCTLIELNGSSERPRYFWAIIQSTAVGAQREKMEGSRRAVEIQSTLRHRDLPLLRAGTSHSSAMVFTRRLFNAIAHDERPSLWWAAGRKLI